ncbi:cation efflux family-domain-containing protein [Neurospora hispaniola]|uniref:Zinc transporter n=1 Tax=Neurospora hispaniola TaxID=588809 RepID=A0AAJ0IG82_9PEZI|nr:cation efflux family-domain-containing protein [Neurospora hispaniola]
MEPQTGAKPNADYGRSPLTRRSTVTKSASTLPGPPPLPLALPANERGCAAAVDMATATATTTSTPLSTDFHHNSPNSRHMATGLPVIAPAIVYPAADDDHGGDAEGAPRDWRHNSGSSGDAIETTIISLALDDRDQDDTGSHNLAAPLPPSPSQSPSQDNRSKSQGLLLSPTYKPPISPRSTTFSSDTFLHPDHANLSLLRSPSPDPSSFAMASQDGSASPTTGESSAPPKNPFNFQTQIISSGPVKSNIGQRRGHRYKHSSISAQHSFFQEPPPRPPPVLPASLPIPTFKEAWHSMQKLQRMRFWWCCCHAAIAGYVFLSAEGSLAMTALSHLVAFDVGSAAVCVAVDVLGNFEVWRRSSIRHPFGLQRAEVLAGFAMSVFLVFGGFDLLSHNIKHALENVGEHAPHHPLPDTLDDTSANLAPSTPIAHIHAHDATTPRVSAGAVDFASLAAILSTLISAYGLRNHSRIGRVMRVPLPYLRKLLPHAGILSNPFHLLTTFFACVMLLLPLLSVSYFVWLDRLICASIAVSMFVLGTRLAIAQGLMLLMSYSGPRDISHSPPSTAASSDKKMDSLAAGENNNNSQVSAVVREIESEPQIKRVEEAQFWQVHYGLAMANLKVCLATKGMDDGALAQLRSRLARLVQSRLGEGYGRGSNLRWEVTVQMSTDST